MNKRTFEHLSMLTYCNVEYSWVSSKVRPKVLYEEQRKEKKYIK